ncbi:MAG: glycosyltransferase family 4 protein [Acidimicrobiales bacterium]
MRIAATIEQFWHPVPGGTATAIGELMGHVARVDPSVEFVGITAWHRRPPTIAAPLVPLVQQRLPRRAMYGAWSTIRWPHVEGRTGAVDVVHATSLAIAPTRAPLVVTVHDLAFLTYPGHASRRGQAFFERSWQITKDEATIIVCPSQATVQHCIDEGVSPERLRVVPWGSSRSMALAVDVERVARTYDLPDRFVLFVGTIEPRKNLDRLIKALATLTQQRIPLVLVGPTGWGDSLATTIEQSGLDIRRLGFVPEADLSPLYRAATLMAYPSLMEGFGLPVLDAMTQATPVVTSAGTSTEELVGQGGICVDPQSVTSIADGLRQVLEDADLAQHLGRKGAEQATKYTWERSAQAMIDVYEEAVR